jgi:hypothetical protein
MEMAAGQPENQLEWPIYSLNRAKIGILKTIKIGETFEPILPSVCALRIILE